MTDSQNRPPEPPQVPENEKNDTQLPLSERNIVPNTNMPNPNMPNPQPTLQQDDFRKFKSARTLVTIASIAGPVSVFFGGIFLSTVGLICGIVAYRKINAHAKEKTALAAAIMPLRRSSIIGMVLCGIALVLNSIALYIMYPQLLAMVNEGLVMPGNVTEAPTATWG